MYSERVKEVIDKTVNYLSQDEGVGALVLVGSQVEGGPFPADEYSDIELYSFAIDEKYEEVKRKIEEIEKIFPDVVFSYENRWAGWSVLFSDFLRLELPIKRSTEEFTHSDDQKENILYQKPGFSINRGNERKEIPDARIGIEKAIQDFWYMAVWAAQHIARGELWLARGAIRISMQGKVKRLIEETYHPESLGQYPDRRIELTWGEEELKILRETSAGYDRTEIVSAFWSNIKYFEKLLFKLGAGSELFVELKDRLVPGVSDLLK